MNPPMPQEFKETEGENYEASTVYFNINRHMITKPWIFQVMPILKKTGKASVLNFCS